MLLTGSYRRTLDDQLRLAIPKPLRDQLEVGMAIYLTPGLDGCLAVYPQEAFTSLADRLSDSSPAAREVRDYSRLFFSQAACVTPDSQWRFRIPVELIKWAQLSGETVVVGVRDHLEVWASDRWEEYVAGCEGQYEQLAEAALLGSSGAAPASPTVPPSHTLNSATTEPRNAPR